MKTNEFRVGNFIYWNIPEKVNIIHEIIIIEENDINTIPISFGNYIDDYLPILLTDDWLIKFGFEECEDSEGWQHKKTGIMFYKGFFTDIQKHSIKYVHQFQNLYFALTDEELIIESE